MNQTCTLCLSEGSRADQYPAYLNRAPPYDQKPNYVGTIPIKGKKLNIVKAGDNFDLDDWEKDDFEEINQKPEFKGCWCEDCKF